ncbi:MULTISPECIES: hypothetical protein [unclassified Lysobacter]|uniref:hypothetical protein n=1 Tax=unclassified Lysobacter TaxID=2635362 RepID=UPI0006F8F4CB|nr:MULTISPECIES: hypothetical protein [unclassified Lysobacter]KRA14979.1 hypothetical protein ASD69_19105 [Lysobacter sp. Root604]KRD30130.1 hypothetical protein ASE35_18610 [Lysobacter sp. Root916]KRD75549.1 hypothetical protein ASE43_11800 [Lysobacter sp. Root983]
MLRTRPLIVATLLALAPLAAFAQSLPPIQQEMTPEQFKAAGLDKLSAEELGRLNDWLNRKIGDESAKAAKSAKEVIETEHRGFFNFGGSSDPIASRISGEFRGFGRGRQYTLDNGQVWQQSDDASLAGVKLSNPEVKINPGLIGNVWYLSVQGYNARAKVQRIK